MGSGINGIVAVRETQFRGCKGCLFDGWMDKSETSICKARKHLKKAGLPNCRHGYIYQLLEVRI